MTLLARERGYALAGTNGAGNDAFCRRDLVDERFPILSAEEAYAPATYRERCTGTAQLRTTGAPPAMSGIAGGRRSDWRPRVAMNHDRCGGPTHECRPGEPAFATNPSLPDRTGQYAPACRPG